MIFLTMDGDEIDIDRAERIYIRPEADGDSVRYVIIVQIGDVKHRLVSTGNDFAQAEFHCLAINECHINRRLTRAKVYAN